MDNFVQQKFDKLKFEYIKLEKEEKFEEAIHAVDKAITFLEGHLASGVGIMDKPITESNLRDMMIIKRVFNLNLENKELRDQLANHSYKIKQLEDMLKGKQEFQ